MTLESVHSLHPADVMISMFSTLLGRSFWNHPIHVSPWLKIHLPSLHQLPALLLTYKRFCGQTWPNGRRRLKWDVSSLEVGPVFRWWMKLKINFGKWLEGFIIFKVQPAENWTRFLLSDGLNGLWQKVQGVPGAPVWSSQTWDTKHVGIHDCELSAKVNHKSDTWSQQFMMLTTLIKL